MDVSLVIFPAIDLGCPRTRHQKHQKNDDTYNTLHAVHLKIQSRIGLERLYRSGV